MIHQGHGEQVCSGETVEDSPFGIEGAAAVPAWPAGRVATPVVGARALFCLDQVSQALAEVMVAGGGLSEGSEMARYATITATGLPVFFAHPHSPWERGSNENLNRIVREYFPKEVTITSDPTYLAMVASDINDRPRKIHDWKKPSELFTELVQANAFTG